MLGLVMVLSASAAVEASKGESPYHIFNRQVTWAGIGLIGMLIAMRMHLAWVRRLAIPLAVLAGVAMALPFMPGLGSSLNDVTHVFDEPTAGLHPHDVSRMIELLRCLRHKGNTVPVVEHKPERDRRSRRRSRPAGRCPGRRAAVRGDRRGAARGGDRSRRLG